MNEGERSAAARIRRWAILLCLSLAAWAAAADPEIEPDPEPEGNFGPADALYAPEEEGLTPSAGVTLTARSSYYSQARLSAFDVSDPSKLVEGAEIFIDGRYAGQAPLTLQGLLVAGNTVSLSAHAPGYQEGLRPAVRLPREGEVRVALWGEKATRWYTWPCGVLGLLAIGGSLAAYGPNQPESSTLGVGLLIGGAAVIVASQAVARFLHLPALQRRAEAYNRSAEP